MEKSEKTNKKTENISAKDPETQKSGEMEKIVVRPKIARTPPRPRVGTPDSAWLEQLRDAHIKKTATPNRMEAQDHDEYATVSSDDQSEEQQGTKRRRRASPPLQKTKDKNRNSLERTLYRIGEQVRMLENLVRENPNTKKEIKTAIRELTRLNNRITRTIKQQNTETELEQTSTLTGATTVLKVDMGTQTHTTDTKDHTIDDLGGDITLEAFRELQGLKWSDVLYKNTTLVEKGNPIHTADDITKIVWVDPNDTNMEKGVQRGFKEKFPNLEKIESTFETIEQITRTGSEKVISSQKIIRAMQGPDMRKLWENLTRIKNLTRENEKVAIHGIKGISIDTIRKMTEYIFKRDPRKILLFTKGNRKRVREAKERKTYALVVEAKGTYNDTLKKVKESIKADGVGDDVIGIRSTRDGKRIVVSTAKNLVKLNKVHEAIKKDPTNLKTTKKVDGDIRLVPLHVRGMDGVVTKEELREGVEAQIGLLEDKRYKIGELRPNANRTQAVTISLEEPDARKLLEAGKIKIGYSWCTVEKRIDVQRCNKCWNYNHISRECKNTEDLSNACYRCGSTEHRWKDCKGPEYCPLCKADHKAGTGKCQYFKKALATMRRGARGQNQPTSPRRKIVENIQRGESSPPQTPMEDSDSLLLQWLRT